jgi:CYTH domain-containing protein
LLNGQFSKNKGDKGYITVKGVQMKQACLVLGKKIPIEEAEKLLLLCEKVIDKISFEVKIGNHL